MTLYEATERENQHLTREDIYKKDEKGRYVLSTAERQKAIAEISNIRDPQERRKAISENMHLFED